MWTPTHVLVTVIRAKSLLDKGKGGNDAYCIIGMGKEKFLTSVRPRTLEPQWGEQAEFNLNERAELKITVYHKSSIIDEFIGRATLDVSSLLSENEKTVTKWFKLAGKPDKNGESSSRKAEKQRGEIEVRVDFIVKPKTGSMMDLSVKSNDHTLSLRNLNGSNTGSFRASLGDKLKNGFGKSKRDKYGAENQLSDQVKKMGGGNSKADFLDGEDLSSLASSYSSLNDPNSIRSGFTQSSEVKKINSMSRFNPARKSIMSRTSSNRADNDLSSLNENDNDLDESSNKSIQHQQQANTTNDTYTFNRRNSSRFGGSFASRRSYKAPPSTNALSSEVTGGSNTQDSSDPSQIHIAPLPSFFDDDFAPSIEQMLKKSIFDKEKKPAPPPPTSQKVEISPVSVSSTKPEAPKAPPPSTANSIAIDDLFVKTSPPPRNNKTIHKDKTSESTNAAASSSSATSDFFDMSKTESQVYSTPVAPGNGKNDDVTLGHNDNSVDDDIDFSYFDLYKKEPKEEEKTTVSEVITETQIGDNPFGDEFETQSNHNNDEEDQIDWVSSDDEDILKKVEKEVQVLSRNNTMENSNTTNDDNNNVNVEVTGDLDKQTDEFINSINFQPTEEEVQEEDVNDPNVTIAPIPEEIGSSLQDETDNIKVSTENVSKSNPLEEQLLNSQTAYNELYNAMSDDINFDDVKNDSDASSSTSSLDVRAQLQPVEFAKTGGEKIYENVPSQDMVEDLRMRAFEEINVDDVSLDSETAETRLDTTNTDLTEEQTVRQSERRKLVPAVDLTSDLLLRKSIEQAAINEYSYRSDQANLNETRASNESTSHQTEIHQNGLPDLLNQKAATNENGSHGMPPVNKIPAEKSLDEVRFNEIEVPESLAKQLEYYDRDELLRLIAYQKKYLDYKESRIRDLENYIDNLVVKIIETEPSILMNASNILSKNIRI